MLKFISIFFAIASLSNYSIVAAGLECNLLHAFFNAIEKGELETVKKLSGQVNLNSKFSERCFYTPLMLAASYGHVHIVRFLLTNPKVNVNIQNEFGETALLLAAQEGHQNIIKILMQVDGINIMACDKQGNTALATAAFFGHETIVKFLLQFPGADINNALINSAAGISSNSTRLNLIKHIVTIPGININAQNGYGTALIGAINWGDLETVKFLLDVPGINIDAKDKRGETALIIAIRLNHSDIVEIIQRRMLKVNGQIIHEKSDLSNFKSCHLCAKPSAQVCAKCKIAYYCCTEHQIADWPSHKLACN